MTQEPGDRITISTASQYGSGWGAEIDLERGVLIKGGAEHPIKPRALARIRAEAEAAHAQGDYKYRPLKIFDLVVISLPPKCLGRHQR